MGWPIKAPDPFPDLLSKECMDGARNFLRDYTVSLISCLRWRMDAGFSLSPRLRQDSFLFIPLRGKVSATVGAEVKVIGPGDIMLVPDNVEHKYELLPRAKHFSAISVHCHIVDRFRLPFLTNCRAAFAHLPHADYWHTALAQLTCTLQGGHDLGDSFGETLLASLMTTLLLTGLPMQERRGEIDPRIIRALQTIHARYAETLTVAELAAVCEISEVHFRNLFQKAMSSSPKAYILQIRLAEAAKLLRRTTLNAKQIAYQAGFHSEQYFHLRFRTAYQCTPLEYRRTLGETF